MATTPANWICSDAHADRNAAVLSSCARTSKVLVVDPDRAVLEMLQIRLDVAGFHPLAARTGTGALEILRNMRPAALVLDAAVAEMPAFDVLTLIQRDRAHLACPILLTGRKLSVEDVKSAATLGVQTCMAKPYSGADLLDRVAKLLKVAKAGLTGASPDTQRPPAPSGLQEILL
jgi:DNA-binding response OmpR family regulator